MVLFPSRSDSLQNFSKRRLPVTIFGRKISSADKWLEIRREPNAHRPAATARRRLHESHVNAIDVRALFAIDFDVHEIPIHDRGGFFVLERFVSHDVAPMAGRVTD